MELPILKSKFSQLDDHDYSLLVEGVTWVTLLIAAADGKIDDTEIAWAEKLANIRSYATPESLNAFYLDVDADFIDRVKSYIPDLPTGTEQRVEYIIMKLSDLNDVLEKMDPETGSLVYKSYLSFAEHVAKAEGGFLRFFSISAAEKKLIGLPMLVPIDYVEEEED